MGDYFSINFLIDLFGSLDRNIILREIEQGCFNCADRLHSYCSAVDGQVPYRGLPIENGYA